MNNFPLKLGLYSTIKKDWPLVGKYIIGQYDADSIIVYQAYNESIARAAVQSQNFHSEECAKAGYLLNRMTWIKTNFLWMMYRSNWAQSKNQERILAIRLKLDGFNHILLNSCVSSKPKGADENDQVMKEWKNKMGKSEVVLQWDPDHTPSGEKIKSRRDIQLGLRGSIQEKFSKEFILNIYDITDFVVEQRENYLKNRDYATLQIPIEQVYPVENPEIANIIRLNEQDEDK